MGGIASTPAQAADPGGDCCADLEERVAELEATTARKSDRKVSLRISGFVNWVGLYWDDGGENDVYIANNTEGSTRFRFTGAAKFKPGWSAGFWIEIAAESARSLNVDQKGDGLPNENADGFLEMRKSAWYIKSDRLGEVWLGRYSPATDDIKLLNIADTPNVNASLETGASFFLRAPQGTGGCAGSGCLYTIRLGALAPIGDTFRGEVIRYNTPSLAGFVFSVSWGEDDIFDVSVRYSKEWNSIRIVGGIGYHWNTDEDEDSVMLTCTGFDPITGLPSPGANNGVIQNTSINNPGLPTGTGNPQFMQASSLNTPCRNFRFDLERLAGSISAMHTPSGMYAYFGGHQDSYGGHSTFDDAGRIVATNIQGLRTGGGRTKPEDGTHWYLQLGVKRRMGPSRKLGQMTLYGEYQEWEDWLVGTSGIPQPGGTTGGNLITNNSPLGFNNAAAATLCPLGQVAGAAFCANGTMITDSEVTSWGFGMVQNIDKAAMELWVGYRQFDPEVQTETVLNAATGDGLPTTVLTVDHRIEDFWHVNVGGRLKF